MQSIPVRIPDVAGDRAYDVAIGSFTPEAIAERLVAAVGKTSGVALIVDGQVARISPRVDAVQAALAARWPGVKRLALAPGESCKTLAEIAKTCEWLAQNGYDRGATLIGLGGGAATDHVGFAAAVYLRGVQFASIPTTLLAMVDASVGGKTGVDLVAGKNLVGAFHQPRAVLADLNFFDTLPARELAAGLAEVVKAGLIADADLFHTLEAEARPPGAWSRDRLAEIIAAAVRVKTAVVTEDERESGRRAILNFGHTIGHAVESASNLALLHGEAVSLGMVAALALGHARGLTPADLVLRTTALLQKLSLPVDIKPRLSPEVLARIEVDKKRRSNQIRFVFVPALGQAILQDVALDDVRSQVMSAL